MRMPVLIVASLLATSPAALAFDLTSPDVPDAGKIQTAQAANVFGCTGQNLSPAIEWSNLPAGTQSLVVTMYDPDAPTGSGFWHWVVFDIPVSATSLPRGAGDPTSPKLPPGAIQSRDDAGIAGYLGACPPLGTNHRYILTVKALKVKSLGLDANASGALVGFVSNANKLAEETITATYGR